MHFFCIAVYIPTTVHCILTRSVFPAYDECQAMILTWRRFVNMSPLCMSICLYLQINDFQRGPNYKHTTQSLSWTQVACFVWIFLSCGYSLIHVGVALTHVDRRTSRISTHMEPTWRDSPHTVWFPWITQLQDNTLSIMWTLQTNIRSFYFVSLCFCSCHTLNLFNSPELFLSSLVFLWLSVSVFCACLACTFSPLVPIQLGFISLNSILMSLFLICLHFCLWHFFISLDRHEHALIPDML